MNTLAAAVQPFVDKNYISGAVLLAATKDRVLACEAVGFAVVDQHHQRRAGHWLGHRRDPKHGVRRHRTA